MFGKLNIGEIDGLLTRQLIGRVGCHVNGRTYVVPISYAYHDNYVYCHTTPGMKLDMMRSNPEVCFQVEDSANLANWQSVIAWGRFEELTSDADRKHALSILENRRLPLLSSETMHLGAHWPFISPNDPGEEGVFFRIQLQEKTGRYELRKAENFFAS